VTTARLLVQSFQSAGQASHVGYFRAAEVLLILFILFGMLKVTASGKATLQ